MIDAHCGMENQIFKFDSFLRMMSSSRAMWHLLSLWCKERRRDDQIKCICTRVPDLKEIVDIYCLEGIRWEINIRLFLHTSGREGMNFIHCERDQLAFDPLSSLLRRAS